MWCDDVLRNVISAVIENWELEKIKMLLNLANEIYWISRKFKLKIKHWLNEFSSIISKTNGATSNNEYWNWKFFSHFFLPMVQRVRTVSWLRDSHTLRVFRFQSWPPGPITCFCYKFIIATSASFQVIEFCCYALLALSEKIEMKIWEEKMMIFHFRY